MKLTKLAIRILNELHGGEEGVAWYRSWEGVKHWNLWSKSKGASFEKAMNLLHGNHNDCDLFPTMFVSIVKNECKRLKMKCTHRNRCGKIYFAIHHNGEWDNALKIVKKNFPQAHMTSGSYSRTGTITVASK